MNLPIVSILLYPKILVHHQAALPWKNVLCWGKNNRNQGYDSCKCAHLHIHNTDSGPKIKTFYLSLYMFFLGFPDGSAVNNPNAMQEIWVWSLGQEDPLEKGMVTHSSVLAWEIPRTEEPGRLLSLESQRIGHDWATNTYLHNIGIRYFCTFLNGQLKSRHVKVCTSSSPSPVSLNITLS